MITGLLVALLAVPAQAATDPHYDVPHGFTRCAQATSWHGFFKWASQRDTTCRAAARFMRDYAAQADGPSMPRNVAGYRCRIHYWRDDEGNTYASRHTCTRDGKTIRFYGMV